MRMPTRPTANTNQEAAHCAPSDLMPPVVGAALAAAGRAKAPATAAAAAATVRRAALAWMAAWIAAAMRAGTISGHGSPVPSWETKYNITLEAKCHTKNMFT